MWRERQIKPSKSFCAWMPRAKTSSCHHEGSSLCESVCHCFCLLLLLFIVVVVATDKPTAHWRGSGSSLCESVCHCFCLLLLLFIVVVVATDKPTAHWPGSRTSVRPKPWKLNLQFLTKTGCSGQCLNIAWIWIFFSLEVQGLRSCWNRLNSKLHNLNKTWKKAYCLYRTAELKEASWIKPFHIKQGWLSRGIHTRDELPYISMAIRLLDSRRMHIRVWSE